MTRLRPAVRQINNSPSPRGKHAFQISMKATWYLPLVFVIGTSLDAAPGQSNDPASVSGKVPAPGPCKPVRCVPASGVIPTASSSQAKESSHQSAQAQTSAAIEFLNSKDYKNAARLFQYAANAGDPRAQTNLGWMYVLGQGLPRDDEHAMLLFLTAAAKRFPNAQDSLGWMYEHGRGVAQNKPLAMGWYKRAADQGFEKGKANFAALQRQGWTPRFEGH